MVAPPEPNPLGGVLGVGLEEVPHPPAVGPKVSKNASESEKLGVLLTGAATKPPPKGPRMLLSEGVGLEPTEPGQDFTAFWGGRPDPVDVVLVAVVEKPKALPNPGISNEDLRTSASTRTHPVGHEEIPAPSDVGVSHPVALGDHPNTPLPLSVLE
jgi:hypothetical protein